MRDRLLLPVGIPVGSLVVIGVVVFLMSRLLLGVPHELATPIALVVALIILLGFAYVGTQAHVSRGQVLGFVGAGLIVTAASLPYLVLAGQGMAESIAHRAEEEAATAGLGAGVVALSSSNNLNVWDKKSITIPASGQVTIRYKNNDAGVLHNFALYVEKGGKAIFQGKNITGPATEDYVFESPGPGKYFFQCDIHPVTMFGEAIAR